MSHLRNALLAGAAVVALAGAAGLAEAQTPDGAGAMHVMNVRMPDGTVQQIRYSGDVAPRVVLVPVVQSVASPFAMMQRISAEMDQQMAMMMRAFSPMGPSFGSAPITAAFGTMPVGAGVCMRSISVTYTGGGQKPQVVSRTAGNCGPSAPAGAVSAPMVNGPVESSPALNSPVVTPERTSPSLHTILVKDEHPVGQPVYRAMMVPAADLRG